jgi:hypothetical protein
MNSIGAIFAIATLAAACGGGTSGVSSDTLVVDLDASGETTVCDYIASKSTAHAATCSDGSTITLDAQTVGMCLARLDDTIANHPSCTATVGDAESCIDAVAALTDADLCAGNLVPAACEQLLAAACTSPGV